MSGVDGVYADQPAADFRADAANLEREPDIESQLGLPNRPRNIRVLQDAMQWQQNGGALLGSTGEAVMAFLSRGHMPDEGKYGPQISKAIDFVLSTQRRRGYFSLLPVTPPVGHLSPAQTVTYNHSIAGLMPGEVYGMTSGERSTKIEAAITNALI